MKKLLLLLAFLALPSLASAQIQYSTIAYNLTATSFTYCTQDTTAASPTCGTAVTDGWIRLPHVGGEGNGALATAVVEWLTKAATSLEWQVECMHIAPAQPVIVQTSTSMTSATNNSLVIWAHNWDSCRIGLKLTTDTGDNSVTAYIVQK